MNLFFLKFHRHLFIILLMVITTVVTVTSQIGELKPVAEFDFFDAAGEGGITLMTLVWIFFILISRPSGKVTNLLFVGLTLTHVSMLLDFIDEFYVYPSDNTWLTTFESLPAPVGMVIMSVALYWWHQEQMSINAQLRNTERYYRDHSLTDFVTGLYSAKYMKDQLQREIVNANTHQQPFTMMLIDIRHFDSFNRKHGDQQGDTLLRETAQLILMNLRDEDLACRYASDRFIILMPNTSIQTAQTVATHIEQAIANLAFKIGNSSAAQYQHVASCVMECTGDDEYLNVLDKLNDRMLVTKHTLNNQATANQVINSKDVA
jgi:diguanylate cyclase (GGDEF)-like protein